MTILIDIDHDAGDLSEYDSLVGAASLAAHADAAMGASAYGLRVTIDDKTGDYGVIALTAPVSNVIRGRFYIDPHSLSMAGGDSFFVMRIWTGSGRVLIVSLYYATATGYALKTSAFDDASTEQAVSNSNIADKPHLVEFYLKRATTNSSNNGVCTVWIDGTQSGTLTNLDNYNRFAAMSVLHVGAVSAIDAGTSGTLYLDELIVNDTGDYIGPNVIPGSITADATIGAVTRMFYANAVIRFSQSGSLTANAVVRYYINAEATIRANQSADVTADSIVVKSSTGTVSADAVLVTANSYPLSVRHESNDLSEYGTTLADGTDLSVTSGAALAGTSYGLAVAVDDAGAIQGLLPVAAASASLRFRFYLDPNSITIPDGHYVTVLSVDKTGPASWLYARVYYVGGAYYLNVQVLAPTSPVLICNTLVTDAEHYVEVLATRGTDGRNDSTCTVWLDGAQAGTRNDLDFYTEFGNVCWIRLGALVVSSTGVSGTLYLDELKVNDTGDEIGALTKSADVTADAAIKSGSGTQSLTADAYVVYTTADSVTTDAVVLRGNTGGVTAGAIVIKTASGSLTADANVSWSQSGTISADATVKATVSGTGATADAAIKAGSGTQTVTADAYVVWLTESSVSGDAIIQVAFSSSVTADALVLVESGTRSLSADAIVETTTSAGVTGDAAIRATTTGSVTSDAVVKARSGTQDVTADAIVKTTTSTGITGDAIVEVAASGSISGDAVVQVATSGSMTGDAVIQVAASGSVSGDATIEVTTSGSVTGDADIQAAQSASVTANAIVLVTTSGGVGGNALVLVTTSGSISGNALVLVPNSGSVNGNAVVKLVASGSISGNAVVKSTTIGSLTASAIIPMVVAQTFTAGAWIPERHTATFTGDAVVKAAQTGSVTANAYVRDRDIVEFVLYLELARGYSLYIDQFSEYTLYVDQARDFGLEL